MTAQFHPDSKLTADKYACGCGFQWDSLLTQVAHDHESFVSFWVWQFLNLHFKRFMQQQFERLLPMCEFYCDSSFKVVRSQL